MEGIAAMTDKRDQKSVVFVDTNILMYVAGREHPHQEPCRQALALIAQEVVEAVTSTEVHQEILHRYLSLGRPEDARSVSKTLQSIVPRTLAVDLADIVRARDLSIIYPTVPARDLVHAAVMLNHGITTVLSVDRHFDNIHEIVRLSPEIFVTEMSQQRNRSPKPSPDASE
jgi:hypothetical protein